MYSTAVVKNLLPEPYQPDLAFIHRTFSKASVSFQLLNAVSKDRHGFTNFLRAGGITVVRRSLVQRGMWMPAPKLYVIDPLVICKLLPKAEMEY